MKNKTPKTFFLLKDEIQLTSEGALHHTSWPGLYPLFYLNDCGQVLCPDCANKSFNELDDIRQVVNWESPDLYCDPCGKLIDSASGEDY